MTRDMVLLLIDRTKFLFCFLFRLSCCSGSRRHTVALRGVIHDQSDNTAGQNDLEIVAMLKICNDKGEHEPHSQTEEKPERHGIHLASENAGGNPGEQSLDRTAEDDAHPLRW